MGMAANDDGFLPAWHKARNIVADDGFAEHCATQDVADGAVGRLPHLLEIELWVKDKSDESEPVQLTSALPLSNPKPAAVVLSHDRTQVCLSSSVWCQSVNSDFFL